MDSALGSLDLAAVMDWARHAGEIALRHFRQVLPERKADRSMVTAADREIERYLRSELARLYPTHGILGEEYGRSEAGSRPRLIWAVDPLDGTVAYAAGLPIWAVSLGLLEDGQPVAGVVYLPLVNEMYWAMAGEGAYFNSQRMTMPETTAVDKDDFLCVPSNSHRRYRIAFAGKCRSFGSTAAHLVYVARGSAWGAVLGRVHLWDIAGGAAILHEAGGRLESLGGGAVDYSVLLDGRPAADHLAAGRASRLAMMRKDIDVIHRVHFPG